MIGETNGKGPEPLVTSMRTNLADSLAPEASATIRMYSATRDSGSSQTTKLRIILLSSWENRTAPIRLFIMYCSFESGKRIVGTYLHRFWRLGQAQSTARPP